MPRPQGDGDGWPNGTLGAAGGAGRRGLPWAPESLPCHGRVAMAGMSQVEGEKFFIIQ